MRDLMPLRELLAKGAVITLTLDDDDAPTYRIDQRLLTSKADDAWSEPGDYELYFMIIEADNQDKAVWEYVWQKQWGSLKRLVEVKP